MKLDLEWLDNNKQYILFECIYGSQMYGLNTPESDIDYIGVFCVPQKYLYGLEKIEKISDEKNNRVYYELSKFCDLLSKSNPSVITMLNPPEDCIKILNPLFKQYFIDNRKDFLTKACYKPFVEYSNSQIKKASGLDKKMNWKKTKVERKDLLDFCYVLSNEKTIPWKKWNEDEYYDVKFIGAVNIPNARDNYALFYDSVAANCFSKKYPETEREKFKTYLKDKNKAFGFGYKGLVKSGEDENGKVNYAISNQLRLSSIPEGEKVICNIIYNKDGYTEHCKDYRDYQEWLANRNIQRYVDVDEHGQQIDGKNMMHVVRLIETAKDIVEKKDIIVRRDNREELLDIKRGKVDLKSLIKKADTLLKELEIKFKESDLDDDINRDNINDILIKIRVDFYEKNN